MNRLINIKIIFSTILLTLIFIYDSLYKVMEYHGLLCPKADGNYIFFGEIK